MDNFNNNQIAPLESSLQSSIDSANSWYANQANNPTTGFATALMNSVGSDYGTAAGHVQGDYQSYVGSVNSLFSSWVTTMMTAMMNGLPMPAMPTTAAEPLTQDYQLQVAAENISLTDQLGAALVAYVSAERGADTTRDLMIESAINTDDGIAITDADALEAAEITDIKLWMDDISTIEKNFEIDDESHYVTMMDDIGDDWKTYVQSADSEQEQFEVDESNDYLAYEQQVDGDVKTFRNDEMSARKTLLDDEADYKRDYEKAIAKAERDWIYGEAGAEDTDEHSVDAAEEQRQDGEADDYKQYVNDIAGDEQGWINTVTTGVASLYAAYYGNAADATAVANAWKNYDQGVAGDWDQFVTGEAQKFDDYVHQEEATLRTEEDDIADHNQTREQHIADDYENEIDTIAPQIDSYEHSVDGLMVGWMTTAATAEKKEADDDASSENGYELILAPQLQALYDQEAADVDSELHTVESQESADLTLEANAVDGVTHAEDGQWQTKENTIRTKHSLQETKDLTSWNTKETTALPAEDGLMVADAADLQAQNDLTAVLHFNDIANQPLSSFDSQLYQSASLMPMGIATTLTDNDYIIWGTAIATVGTFTRPATTTTPTTAPATFGSPPPAPPASTATPQQVQQEVQEAVQPEGEPASAQALRPGSRQFQINFDSALAQGCIPGGRVPFQKPATEAQIAERRADIARDQARLDYYNSILHDVAGRLRDVGLAAILG